MVSTFFQETKSKKNRISSRLFYSKAFAGMIRETSKKLPVLSFENLLLAEYKAILPCEEMQTYVLSEIAHAAVLTQATPRQFAVLLPSLSAGGLPPLLSCMRRCVCECTGSVEKVRSTKKNIRSNPLLLCSIAVYEVENYLRQSVLYYDAILVCVYLLFFFSFNFVG